MPTDVATALPQLELGPGASIVVDAGDPAATVTQVVVYGTYYPPGGGEPVKLTGVFLPVPEDDGAAAGGPPGGGGVIV